MPEGSAEPSLPTSRFRDMNFTRAAAVGGGRDDVLSGGWLTGRLLLQMFSVGLRRVLRYVLLRLQFGLALRDHIVRLPGTKTVSVRCICKTLGWGKKGKKKTQKDFYSQFSPDRC